MPGYRPDRMVRVLTTLASITYYAACVLAVVVLIGLPAVKLLAGDDPEWALGLDVPIASADSYATVVTRWGDAGLEVEDLRGSLRLPISILPWWHLAALWVYMAAASALILMFLHHLRRIFQRVRGGMPFDATNALRLRRLGLLVIALTVLEGLGASIASLVLRGSPVSEGMHVPLGLYVDGSAVLFGLVLLSLSEIFRRGAELEDEQALTV